MRPVPLVVTAWLLSGCGLSNAFFHVPDFQQVDNATACRALKDAEAQVFADCSGTAVIPPEQRGYEFCPDRLNTRDPLCASFFQCQADTLACVDGFPQPGPDAATCDGIVDGRCDDPFADISVTVSFTAELDGGQDCAAAGVVELTLTASGVPGASTTSAGACSDPVHEVGIQKTFFPGSLQIIGLDGPFDDFPNSRPLFVSESIDVSLDDIDAQDKLDLGDVVLHPVP